MPHRAGHAELVAWEKERNYFVESPLVIIATSLFISKTCEIRYPNRLFYG